MDFCTFVIFTFAMDRSLKTLNCNSVERLREKETVFGTEARLFERCPGV